MNTDLEAQRALDKLNRSGFEALTSMEKTIATVWLFESKVANGGFRYYYKSPAGDLAFYAPEALRSIGALELAEIADRANAVFGAGGPPMDRPQRLTLLTASAGSADADWEALEARYYECPEDVDELLEASFAPGQHLTAA